MTNIQWTDTVWNPTTGCSRVSEGCRNCYIERTPPFRMAGRKLGDPVQLHTDRLDAPLRWRKPRRVFVNSMSDLFHEDVPRDFLDAVWSTMAEAKHHIFQVLTKRVSRMREFMIDRQRKGWKADWLHIHLGVSVEDQETADERIPILLRTPAAVRWISAEPLLAPVDIRPYTYYGSKVGDNRGIQWVVVGGESGPKARSCNIAWIRSIVQLCQAASVPVYVKQLGADVADRNDAGFEGDTDDSWPMDTRFEQEYLEQNYQGTLGRVRLHDRKGGDPSEWPEDVRVREFPR